MAERRGKGFIKLVGSFTAGAGMCFLTVAGFALLDPENWENVSSQRHGLPLGPSLLGIGVGLVTAAVLLGVLFTAPWGRKATDA